MGERGAGADDRAIAPVWEEPSGRRMRGRRQRVLAVVALLLPALVYLRELPHFGRLDYNDYYGILGVLAEGDGLTHDPLRWLTVKSNEHTVTVAALVYAANVALTHGDNRALSAYALVMLAVTAALLLTFLPASVAGGGMARALAACALGAFVFTPVAAHNVVMGFSGTIWFTANACAVVAMAALRRLPARQRLAACWIVLLPGLVGAFSNSTNLALWPALLVGAALLGVRRKHVLAIAAAGAAVVLFFALRYTPLPWHPRPSASPLGLARYVAAYLGSLLASHVHAAELAGALALLASVFVYLGLLRGANREERGELAPFLMLQLYALGDALGTAVGRSGWGDTQALSSRYASLAALFWIGFVGAAALLLLRDGGGRRTARQGFLLGAVALLLVGMYSRGLPVLRDLLAQAAGQPVAELAFVHDVRDPVSLTTFHPFAYALGPLSQQWFYRFAQVHHHVPFERRWWTRFGTAVDAGLLAGSPPGPADRFVGTTSLGGGDARVWGTACGEAGAVRRVVLLDADRVVRGEAILNAGLVARLPELRGLPARCLWIGYAHPSGGGERLRAWVRLAGDPRYHPLLGELFVTGSGPLAGSASSATPATTASH
jgi:hypothetical protein